MGYALNVKRTKVSVFFCPVDICVFVLIVLRDINHRKSAFCVRKSSKESSFTDKDGL